MEISLIVLVVSLLPRSGFLWYTDASVTSENKHSF